MSLAFLTLSGRKHANWDIRHIDISNCNEQTAAAAWYVELWYMKRAAHQTNNDLSQNKPCTANTVQQCDDNNNNNNIFFIETRLQGTIAKIIKYRWLG